MRISNLIKSGTYVKFNNGIQSGYGWIRGIATCDLPIIGVSYIVELEANNYDGIYKELYDYPCIIVFDCHLSTLD
jgi:hypothetical protein